jgi:hypothetical protein
MSKMAFTLIDSDRPDIEPRAVPAAIDGSRVLLTGDGVRDALGWEARLEGLCRDAMCVPMPGGAPTFDPNAIDLGALAGALGRPLALDASERAACLGVRAEERAQALASLEAPDFTLPDLDGCRHSLSDHRGKKVLLVAYASW